MRAPNLTSCRPLCPFDGLDATASAGQGQNQTVVGHPHRRVPYQKVLGARKRPVLGLWIRNETLYARISVEAPQTGRKPVRRVPLENVETVAQAQPTIFLDLALAPKAPPVPVGDGLPDRAAAEGFLVVTALNPFLVEVAAQRARETATIEKHLKISLNELIHRQNLRMAEIQEQGQFGEETLMAANMKKVEDKLDEPSTGR